MSAEDENILRKPSRGSDSICGSAKCLSYLRDTCESNFNDVHRMEARARIMAWIPATSQSSRTRFT